MFETWKDFGAFLVAMALFGCLLYVVTSGAYDMGVKDARLSVVPVACQVNYDSVVVHTVYRPTGTPTYGLSDR